MPAVFQQALAPPQQPAPQTAPPDMFAPWVDPNAAQLAQLQTRLDAPQQPTFSPAQIKQRQDDNARQYALGLLGQMSGNQQLGEVGGTVFKQALANRQPKYTDHGTYDPITGEFNYSPDYLYDRTQQQYNTVSNRSAAQQNNYVMNQQRLLEKMQATRENNERSRANAFVIAGGGGLGAGTPVQIGSGGPDGSWPIYRGKTPQLFTYDQSGQAVPYQGAVSPKETSATPTEDQAKAAAWFQQASKASADMQRALALDPSAATPTPLESAVGALPKVGGTAVNGVRSPGRQMFMQGASSFAEAVLRAATGAGVNEQEAAQKIAELTPGPLDSPELKAQKLASQPMYLATLHQRAGKALQAPATGGPAPGQAATGAAAAPAPAAGASDPWGVRSRLFPGG